MRLPRTAAWLAFVLVLSAGAVRAQNGSGTTSTTSPSSSKASAKPVSHKKKHHGTASRRQPTQKAPTADRITEIQSALAHQGYYQGDPTGKWDANTVAAVEKFQSSNGIDANGKLDAPTLQKLGLGSEIAGVSAPKQVMPAASTAPATAPPATENTAPSGSPAVAENSAAVGGGAKAAQH